jgi:hypothetical protein
LGGQQAHSNHRSGKPSQLFVDPIYR